MGISSIVLTNSTEKGFLCLVLEFLLDGLWLVEGQRSRLLAAQMIKVHENLMYLDTGLCVLQLFCKQLTVGRLVAFQISLLLFY